MPKKETTIDDLAVMVQKGFFGVDKKFVEIEKNMAAKDEMRKGFEGVNKRFEEVNQRLIKIERKIDSNYEQRIEQLEDDVEWLKGQLTFSG
jgi:predicted nuclease with TOPRIM domain